MKKHQTLVVIGPQNFKDRTIIIDNIIDCMCDWEITKIITGDRFGVDQIVSELVGSYTDIEYERVYPDFNKFGKKAKLRSIWWMMMQSTHLLLFDDHIESTYDVRYFAKRYDLQIKVVDIKKST